MVESTAPDALRTVIADRLNRGRLPRLRPRNRAEWLFAAYVASMPLYCLVRISADPTALWAATALTCAAWFLCALAAARAEHGVRRSGAMLVSGFAIALTSEYLGSRYGVLFGEYDYTDLLGFRLLGEVPILVPTAWFMMLYPSWKVAGFLTARLRDERARTAARIVVGAAAMTAWDLSLDPRWVADGAWIWPNGGVYFGIPPSNFVGWFVTSALIFVAWTLLARRTSPLHQSSVPQWVYVVAWIGESMANVLFWSGPAIGAIVFVAMGLFALPFVRTKLTALRAL
jgi:putative membrane protein